ncbi:MAG: C10 family peptidase [Bacteroidetes bacterium]|nr:C10 family peptidase [Bacteroidota bacterium]
MSPFINLKGDIVPLDEAKKVALNQISIVHPFFRNGLVVPEISNYSILLQDGIPAIYLFDLQPSGFIFISAESNAWPVLGYSLESPIQDEKPLALKSWITSWKNQIAEIRQENLQATEIINLEWDALLQADQKAPFRMITEIAPLLDSKWGQHVYYNAMCPEDPDGPGGHALAGCVAIAISQVMFYYRYPETGNGSHGYFSDYGYEFVDFGATTYHWNDMVNSIYGMGNPAIAELIYHVGVSVEMDYSASGSGSLTQDGAQALTDYFRYSPSTSYLNRFDVPDSFKDSLIHNLDQYLPCVVRGGDLSSSHSFVCDGYQDSLYFHFNWGWNSNWDGYFFIDNLNPGGYNFTFNQGAIINIYPLEDYPAFCQSPDTLTAKRGTFTDGSGPEHYLNNSSCSWLIEPQGAAGSSVMIWFPDLNLEAEKDFIYLYDGSSSSDPLLATITGNFSETDYQSSGGSLFLVFESDETGTDQGFQAEYISINGPWCNELTTYTDFSKTWFSDASGPYPYIANSDCHWIIQPQVSAGDSVSGIAVFFHEFNLAAGDTLFLKDASHPATPDYAALTGSALPDTVFTNTNQLEVIFSTDDTHAGAGWGAGYASLPPVYCEDTVTYTQKTGFISDGSGDKNYVNNSSCYWLITYDEAEVITLAFSEFELEWGYDQLRIYDAAEYPAVLIQTLWGDEIPEPLTFHTNRLLLNFITDESSVYSGWSLHYTALAPGVDETDDITDFSIQPNPVHDWIRIKATLGRSELIRVRIYNALATKLVEKTFEPVSPFFDETISFSDFPGGIYFIEMKSEQGMVTSKFLKH